MATVHPGDYWLNPESFTTRPIPNSDLVEFWNDSRKPTTFVSAKYGCIVPNYHATRPLVTDGCSTRRWMAALPFIGKYFTATRYALEGYLHDDLYQHGGYHDLSGRLHKVTRQQADEILYLALLAAGAPELVAKAYYCGVRAGGWVPWANYRKKGSDKS